MGELSCAARAWGRLVLGTQSYPVEPKTLKDIGIWSAVVEGAVQPVRVASKI
jgi:hypothetical protein